MAGISSVIPHQIALIGHFPIIFTAFIYRGPYGNYRFNPHLLELFYHGIRIRPVSWLKFKFSLHGPVEKVYHDSIHGKPSPFMLSCNGQKLLLISVAQLALPVSHAIFRHHGSSSGSGAVLLQNFCGRISCGNEIVHLFGRPCMPFRFVCPKGNHSDRRVIPEKTIASA